MADIKRPNYFNSQFLKQEDFLAEQSYHRNEVKRHNLHLHSPGVVYGLEVHKTGAKQITVSPGMAIDSNGQEIVLNDPQPIDISNVAPGTNIAVTIWYTEAQDTADKYGDTNFYTRVTEHPKLSPRDGNAPAAGEGPAVTLAQVPLDASGQVVDENNFILTGRQLSTVPANSIGTSQVKANSIGISQIKLQLVAQGASVTVLSGPSTPVQPVQANITAPLSTIYWPTVTIRSTTAPQSKVQAFIVYMQNPGATTVDIGIGFNNQGGQAVVDWRVYTIGA